MVMLLTLILVLIFAIVVLVGGDPSELTNTLGKAASMVFPRMGSQGQTTINTDDGL